MSKDISNLENLIASLRNFLANPDLSLELRTNVENLLYCLEHDLEAARNPTAATVLEFPKHE